MFACGSVLVFLAQVLDSQLDTLVEVGQLAQAVLKGGVVVFRHGEDLRVGMEMYSGAALVGLTNLLDGIQRNAAAVLLAVYLAVAVHLSCHTVAQRVDAAYAHAVQTAADLVAAFVELAAGVQHGHNDFEG